MSYPIRQLVELISFIQLHSGSKQKESIPVIRPHVVKMQYAIKETVQLHVNVLRAILEIPIFIADQSVQQIASVQRQNHAGIINAMIHALDYVGEMLNAKLSIIFQTACAL